MVLSRVSLWHYTQHAFKALLACGPIEVSDGRSDKKCQILMKGFFKVLRRYVVFSERIEIIFNCHFLF